MEIKYVLSSDNTYNVTCEDINIEELVLPEEYNGLPITGFAYGAFQKCQRLQKVYLPSSIKEISKKCFFGCDKLKYIEFAQKPNIQKIRRNAFSFTNLEKFEIPKSVFWVGAQCFYACHNLKEVYIPSSVEIIGANCFNDCPNLESVIFERTDNWFISDKEDTQNCTPIKVDNPIQLNKFLHGEYSKYYMFRKKEEEK